MALRKRGSVLECARSAPPWNFFGYGKYLNTLAHGSNGKPDVRRVATFESVEDFDASALSQEGRAIDFIYHCCYYYSQQIQLRRADDYRNQNPA